MNNIQAFYLTPGAREALGSVSTQQWFSWHCHTPELQRLTFGELDADTIEIWREVCDSLFIEPLLVLGPGDATPDIEMHPMLVGLDIVTAHKLLTPDATALREMLREPDEAFTLEWKDFAAGERLWFVPPGPLGQAGAPFWAAYAQALAAYKGPVFGQHAEDFINEMRDAWTAPLTPEDLGARVEIQGSGFRFPLRRFPFGGLRLDLSRTVWATEGWLPDKVERVDPLAAVRQALLKALAAELALAPETSAQPPVPPKPTLSGVVQAGADFLAGAVHWLLMGSPSPSAEQSRINLTDLRAAASSSLSLMDMGRSNAPRDLPGSRVVLESRDGGSTVVRVLLVQLGETHEMHLETSPPDARHRVTELVIGETHYPAIHLANKSTIKGLAMRQVNKVILGKMEARIACLPSKS